MVKFSSDRYNNLKHDHKLWRSSTALLTNIQPTLYRKVNNKATSANYNRVCKNTQNYYHQKYVSILTSNPVVSAISLLINFLPSELRAILKFTVAVWTVVSTNIINLVLLSLAWVDLQRKFHSHYTDFCFTSNQLISSQISIYGMS